MTSIPHDRYSRDSASVENCGPSMFTYAPPRWTVAPTWSAASAAIADSCPQTGCANATCATSPRPKNVLMRPRWIAERRGDSVLFAVDQLGHVVEATATDNADFDAHSYFVVFSNTKDTRLALRRDNPVLPICGLNVSGRDHRIVVEEDEHLPRNGFPHERAFRGERVHRIQIERPDPRLPDMRRRRHQIGGERRRLATGFQDHHLMVRRVPTGPSHLHARHDRHIVVHQLEHAGVSERQ